ncbi:MAG: ABC transporter permease subunit, partial [Spirochaetaceae bacterium]|nr:ABC transporter permease subunit [Spirochaetaceae bacterium]
MDAVKRMILWIPPLLGGARVTIALTILAVSGGLVLSLFLALGKMSKNTLVSRLSSAYIFFFRGTPLLMQLYFIYYALPMVSPVFIIKTG